MDRHVLDYVRSSLPEPPARVLEVGAGSGELAEVLRAAGYAVLAIDPASTTPAVARLALLDVGEPARSFDAAVAVVSLHHVDPLAESCAHLAKLMQPGAVLVVDEFDSQRLDARAAEWWSEHHAQHPDPEKMAADLRSHLHPLPGIREQLGRWFSLSPVTRGPYLYRFELPEELRPQEEQRIAEGHLPATGARFTGRRKIDR
jgi:SAM-dependent methyltransferase